MLRNDVARAESRNSFDQKIISSFFIGGNEVGRGGELKLVYGERHCRKNQVCPGNVFSFFFFFHFICEKKIPRIDANKWSKSAIRRVLRKFWRGEEERGEEEKDLPRCSQEQMIENENDGTMAHRRDDNRPRTNNPRTCNKKTEKSHFE